MGYTQRQVARLLGLYDTKPLTYWEKGKTKPDIVMLLKLSIVYRTFPNELYHDLFIELREELRALELQWFVNQ
jgi:transcriptional regulator with XRE-family HTH domain